MVGGVLGLVLWPVLGLELGGGRRARPEAGGVGERRERMKMRQAMRTAAAVRA
jgi:hypothetical protein